MFTGKRWRRRNKQRRIRRGILQEVVINTDLQMLQPGYTMLYLDGTQQLFNPLAP